MYRRSTLKITACCVVLIICTFKSRAQGNFIKNPIVAGYYADPTIIKDKGIYYIYATIDPWGAAELGVLETKDFKTFTKRHINWPTKTGLHQPPHPTAIWFGRHRSVKHMANFICM